MLDSLDDRPSVAPEKPEVWTMLDLFAGVGGLSEGIRRGLPGIRTLEAVEMDPRAAAGYALNHNVNVHAGSIQAWLREKNEAKKDGNLGVPHVDVVIGGPPCQGFSTLGKRDVEDERNSLWREYAEAVYQAQPRYFVMENVPAFLSSPQFGLLRDMTGRDGILKNYKFEARILNSAHFGAAQVRKRVIVLGTRIGQSPLAHPVATHADESTWRTVRDCIGDVGNVTTLPSRRVSVGDSITGGPFTARELHVTRNFSQKSLERFESIPLGGNRFNIPTKLLSECWKKHKSGSGDVMGRLHWNKPSVTIRTEFIKPEKGRYLHPELHRSITPFEGALLQGFPEDYKFIGSMTDIVRQIGNAVPIPLGAAIGRSIFEALEASTRQEKIACRR